MISPRFQKLAKDFPILFRGMKKYAAELTQMTPEQIRAAHGKAARESERTARQYKRELRQAWKNAGKWRRLARQLGVNGVFVGRSKSGVQGEYNPHIVGSDSPGGWDFSDWELPRTRVREIVRVYGDALILIDVENNEESIPNVISHELGHHIDSLAHGKTSVGRPNRRMLAAFKRAKLHVPDFQDKSEIIAESIGAYLRGAELPALLLPEVRKVIAKLPRSKGKLINEFRRSQITRREAVAA